MRLSRFLAGWRQRQKALTTSCQRFFIRRLKPLYYQAVAFARRRPGRSFFGLLVILLLLIITGNFLRSARTLEPLTPPETSTVSVFAIGQAPTVRLEGRVEKSGQVTVVAQTAGIVRKIHVTHGQSVIQGKTLLDLASNYHGGNLPALQQNLAYLQYSFNQQNLEAQKALLNRQRDIAQKTVDNTDELREINRLSLEDTRGQLDLNTTILSSLDENLAALEQATPSAENAALILSTQQLKSQFLAAANQLRSLIRTNEYQITADRPPTELAGLQKDLTLAQLDLQDKTLDLNLEVSRLNYRVAQVAASLMFPASPLAATVDLIHVRPNQFVNPGQPLVTLTGASDQLILVAAAAPQIGRRLSKLEPATVFIDGTGLQLLPQHLTTEPILEGQYRLIFHLPPDSAAQVFHGQYLPIEIPLGYADSVAAVPSVPIDAVYQLEDASSVFVAEDGRAVSREVRLGQVTGSFVEILDGLQSGDLIITSRNVVSGSQIEF